MEMLLDSLKKALELIGHGDPDLLSAVWISLEVSLLSTLLAALVGLPMGVALTVLPIPGRKIFLSLCETLMAVPTVVVGLLLYSLLFRGGPLGPLDLLFTPSAMVMGQAFLTLPLVTALAAAAVRQVDPRVREEAWVLGAGRRQIMLLMLIHARAALAVALFSGLGRALSEVGCAMMVGGNIKGFTRNLTTAIALETGKGDFSLGMALGMILLLLALILNYLTVHLRRRQHAGSR